MEAQVLQTQTQDQIIEHIRRRRAAVAAELSKELNFADGGYIASLARRAGFYVIQVPVGYGPYVVAVDEPTAEAFLRRRLDEFIVMLHKEINGCRSRKCCVKIRRVLAKLRHKLDGDRVESAYVSFYVELIRRFAPPNIVVENGKITRVCILR